jgi:DNA-binding NarL/FixJ family response regulator
MTIRIFIVEDHIVVRNGYGLLLNREPDLAVCGAVASAGEALTLIPTTQPDLILIDLSLPGMNGLALIAQLYKTQPTLPILIVSGYERSTQLNHHLYTLPKNLKGYLQKNEVPQRLVATIRQVLAL